MSIERWAFGGRVAGVTQEHNAISTRDGAIAVFAGSEVERERLTSMALATPALLAALEDLVPSERACPRGIRREVDAARDAISRARGGL